MAPSATYEADISTLLKADILTLQRQALRICPREILPLSYIAAALFDFCIACLMLALLNGIPHPCAVFNYRPRGERDRMLTGSILEMPQFLYPIAGSPLS